MTGARIVGGLVVAALVLLVLIAGYRALERELAPAEPTLPAAGDPVPEPGAHPGFLYGRVTTHYGATYQGRLRWGGDEEAFWGDYFNGRKQENPWAVHVAPERLRESYPVEIFGVELTRRERAIELSRPFMVRFGDIARIEAGDGLQVTLKSGSRFDLDRLAADDLADGLRVWDDERGVVDLHERQIRSVELRPTARPGPAPERLHGTVRTAQGPFTGFVQWERRASLGSDALVGVGADGALSLRFDSVRSIARSAEDDCLVTLDDGREVELSVGDGHRGSYVDDARYGRVLISWEAFERVDFSPGGGSPAYGDFPPGHALTGSVSTIDGRRLAGRLVYDLDESESTETLDAPSGGVNYTIPFGLIASIVRSGEERTGVTLHHGETLQLEQRGDLAEGNAGMLVFVDGAERPEYLSWSEVARVDFDGPREER